LPSSKGGVSRRPPIKKLPNKKSYAKGNILLKYKGKRLAISPFGGGKRGRKTPSSNKKTT